MKKSVIKYKKVKNDKIKIIDFENVATKESIINEFGENVFLEYIKKQPHYFLKTSENEEDNTIQHCISLNLKFELNTKQSKYHNCNFFLYELILKKNDILKQNDFDFIIGEMKKSGNRLMKIRKKVENNKIYEIEI